MDNIKIKIIAVVFIFLATAASYGQDRYVVKYKYKPTSEYSLDEPSAFLTQKALDRRTRERVEVDSTDLPVSPRYIDAVKGIVEKVYYSSKWFNASIVVATEEQIGLIKELDFVEEGGVELVAKGYYAENERNGSKILKSPVNIQMLSKSNAEEDYAFQNGLLGVPDMHAEGLTGAGITIAVFDGGFFNTNEIDGMRHLFDENRLLATKDFVFPWSDNVFRADTHGTSALSLLAANDITTLVSGAFDANYILCITEDIASEYRIEEYNWARAAEYADSLGTDIISSSLGYTVFSDQNMNYDKSALDGNTALITKAANLAAQRGILVVSSAGNEGGNAETTITAPADAKGIITVGAINMDMSRSSFSSVGPTADGRIKPDLMALGNGVRLWRGTNKTSTSSGTSFSAPQIAALAAGIWQGRPDWTKDMLIHYLMKSGNNADDPDNEFGYGVPNFELAYFGEILEAEERPEIYETKIYPNPMDGTELFILFGTEEQCHYTLIDTSGKIVGKAKLSRTSNLDPYEVQLSSIHTGLYVVELAEGVVAERHKLWIR